MTQTHQQAVIEHWEQVLAGYGYTVVIKVDTTCDETFVGLKGHVDNTRLVIDRLAKNGHEAQRFRNSVAYTGSVFRLNPHMSCKAVNWQTDPVKATKHKRRITRLQERMTRELLGFVEQIHDALA